MAQKTNQPQTEFCREFEQLAALLSRDDIKIKSITDIKGQAVNVVYEFLEEAAKVSKTTNCINACKTTANARVSFYRSLEILREKVLYMDTGL